jgi:hypothetical protein
VYTYMPIEVGKVLEAEAAEVEVRVEALERARARRYMSMAALPLADKSTDRTPVDRFTTVRSRL